MNAGPWLPGSYLAFVLALSSPLMLTASSSQRDAARPIPVGTARVSGIVLTTEPTPQPIRRAIVSLSGGISALGRHTITDEDGRFQFDALPAGRYELSAARPSYVTIPYGANRPGRPGTPLVLEPGQHLTGLSLLLARGAVITGTVRDAAGDPIKALEVRVEGQSRNAAAQATTTVTTDDRGGYRVFGLQAGTYVVSARPSATGTGELDMPSDAEVDAALLELRRRHARGPQAVAPSGTIQETARRAADQLKRTHDFVAIYHPSAFTSDDAAPITLRAGEERAAVDIIVRMMSTAVVAGRIVSPNGELPSDIRLSLTRTSPQGAATSASAPVGADGTFRLASVAPGRYLLTAKAMSPEMVRTSLGFSPPGSDAVTAGPCAFASTAVSVTADDVIGLSLILRSCLRIAGRLSFAGNPTVQAPPSFTGVRVTLQPDTSDGARVPLPSRMLPVLSAAGRFLLGEFGDVLPGAYHLSVEFPGTEPGRGWWLQSATADGRDILDLPLELTPESPAITTVALTFTDEHTSLSGVLETAAGRAAVDYTVIAFTTNRDWWRAPFRRVRTAQPATNGFYVFHDLPPGEYYLAALTEFAPDDWRDPAFLNEIVGAAVRITINPGEQRVQNFRIGRE